MDIINNINLTGIIGNAEFKELQNTSLLVISLAVKKKFVKDKENDTIWFRCNLWGTRAEKLKQYLVKGAGIAVSGEMQLDYDKEKKTTYAQVNVDSVDIIKWVDNEKQESNNQQPQKPSNDMSGFQTMESDDDIPF